MTMVAKISAVALVCLFAAPGLAQQASDAAPKAGPAVGYTLITTIFASGFSNRNIRIGKNTTKLDKHRIDKGQTFICAEGKTCRVEFQIVGQVFKGATEDNSFSFCGVVDDTLLQGASSACVKLGFVPNDGKPIAAASLQISDDVASGPHTVQFVANSDYAAIIGNYNAVYRIYTRGNQ